MTIAGPIACTDQTIRPQDGGSVVGSLVGKPKRTLTYSDDKQFNRELSASMRAGISPVKINLTTPFDIEAVPTQLDRWYFEIDQTGGEVISCPTEEARMRSLLTQLLLWVASAVWDRLQDEWVFAPAKSYHAVNFVAADQRTVRRVEFIRRGEKPPC